MILLVFSDDRAYLTTDLPRKLLPIPMLTQTLMHIPAHFQRIIYLRNLLIFDPVEQREPVYFRYVFLRARVHLQPGVVYGA